MKKTTKVSILLSTLAFSVLHIGATNASAGIIGNGPVMPVSKLCRDYQALYPNTSLTDIGDGLVTTVSSYENVWHAGYAKDFEEYPYVAVIFDRKLQPAPAGTDLEFCVVASVHYLEGDPGRQVYNLPDTCYFDARCVPSSRTPKITQSAAEELYFDTSMAEEEISLAPAHID